MDPLLQKKMYMLTRCGFFVDDESVMGFRQIVKSISRVVSLMHDYMRLILNFP